MSFQSTINVFLATGVPGELFVNGPIRAQSFIINSGTPANNVFGTAFTISSQGVAQSGGIGVFAGILVNPKIAASFGTQAGGPLASTLILPNLQQGTLLTMGSIIIQLTAAAAIGDSVIFNQTTGALSNLAPGGSLPSGYSYANGVIDYYTVTGSGLAIATFTPPNHN